MNISELANPRILEQPVYRPGKPIEQVAAEHGLNPGDAYILCSVALDLRVTQLVDGTKGIHGMLAKDLFR